MNARTTYARAHPKKGGRHPSATSACTPRNSPQHVPVLGEKPAAPRSERRRLGRIARAERAGGAPVRPGGQGVGGAEGARKAKAASMATPSAQGGGKGQRPLESLPTPEEVIANRSGDVLIKHTTLKADHFPSEPVGCSSRGGGVGCRILPPVCVSGPYRPGSAQARLRPPPVRRRLPQHEAGADPGGRPQLPQGAGGPAECSSKVAALPSRSASGWIRAMLCGPPRCRGSPTRRSPVAG